jgi:DDE superfamily endonuclease
MDVLAVLEAQDLMEEVEDILTALLLLTVILCSVRVARRNQGHDDPQVFAVASLTLVCFIQGLLLLFELLDLDSELMDVPIDEEVEEVTRAPEKWRRIDEFRTDDQARAFTNFTRGELRRLNNLIGLTERVRVKIGRTGSNYCVFHREQLLLYVLIRMKGGHPKTVMAETITGGDARKWSYGYRFMVRFIDAKYRNLIGPYGLRRCVPQFGDFAEAIRRYVIQERCYIDPEDGGVHHVEEGVWFDPHTLGIAGCLDCKDYQVPRPHQGPDGDYVGSMRRPGAYEAQRSVYSGHRKKHGVRILALGTPDGLTAAVFGPTSSRRHDARILHENLVDELLTRVQLAAGIDEEHLFKFYGDSAFQGAWRCIRSRHERPEEIPLTPRERGENRVMKKVRESIEWSFDQVDQLWLLAGTYKHRKLEVDPRTLLAEIRVMHLLTNCVTCLRGNQISGARGFRFNPPSLENYLESIIEPLHDGEEVWL